MKFPTRLLRFGLLMGLLIIVPAAKTGVAQPNSPLAPNTWQQLEPGLELGGFTSPPGSPDAGAVINVLRIDTQRFELELHNASAHNDVLLTPKQWARAKGLVAVINASMFQADLVTSVSLMRTEHHTNNSYQSGDKAILAFNPAAQQAPRVKIIDRQCDDFDTWKKQYKTLIQSIRMISCRGRNVWTAQSKKSSISAVAMDRLGNLLFIHTEDEFSVHDLIDVLIDLPLEISQAMYVEGGPQAQLYVGSGGRTIEFTGSFNTLFSGGASLAWPLPNVIGIKRKKP
jgi:hypothetical protein